MRRTATAVAFAMVALSAVLAGPSTASAHGGNPDFRSEIKAITPSTDGLSAEIDNFDADLKFTNDSDQAVTVMGYEGEPYLRFDPDGTVYVNKRSPAAYLNSDRYGDVDVPPSADPKAAPDWEQVATGGEYTWHDHRSHYMSTSTPKQVTDPDVRTKIFDYSIPIEVGTAQGAIRGTLYWVGPPDDSAPVAPFVALGLATIALIALVVIVRRRRRGSGGDGNDPSGAAQEPKEAW
jgi:hypothetical protein